mmetsp:Transcript_36778/g.103797  ORF Transcript_36778/g.103797 Transcript_36778/m.103797 type:complete len:273 (+) Transcript_36778:64-882(+)
MEGATADSGFDRPEMLSERLAGSVNAAFGRHLFLVWGKASEWPEKPPGDCPAGSLPQVLAAALDAQKKTLKSKVKWNLVEARDGDEEGDVLVFPDYVRFRVGAGAEDAGLKALLAFLSGAGGGQAGDMEDLGGSFVFVCAHAKRDARCAHCGPGLVEAIEGRKKEGSHAGLEVRKCSHVGGHKYAGNAIVFSGRGSRDDGHWYGYVTPKDVAAVISGRAARGPLWRGRLGLSDTEAKQEWRAQRVRDRLPLVAALSALVVVGALIYQRRKKA